MISGALLKNFYYFELISKYITKGDIENDDDSFSGNKIVEQLLRLKNENDSNVLKTNFRKWLKVLLQLTKDGVIKLRENEIKKALQICTLPVMISTQQQNNGLLTCKVQKYLIGRNIM